MYFCIQIKFRQADNGIWWRNIPTTERCELNALAVPPAIINVTTIQLKCTPALSLKPVPETNTQFVITVALSWDPPSPLHGGNQYEISISDRHINDPGINNPLTYFVKTDTFAEIINRTIFVSEIAENLFIQVYIHYML